MLRIKDNIVKVLQSRSILKYLYFCRITPDLHRVYTCILLLSILGPEASGNIFSNIKSTTTDDHLATSMIEEFSTHLINIPTKDDNNLPTCTFYVDQRSAEYFQSRLEMMEPRFVEFKLVFKNYSHVNVSYHPDVFRGQYWYWTFSSNYGSHPYLSWNVDYGILSFGLLYAETTDVSYVVLTPENLPCATHFGARNTTKEIVRALKELIDISKGTFHEYEDNYFCYLAKNPACNKTIKYQLGLYLDFPVDYINYNCCRIKYDYGIGSFSELCFDKQVEKWSQCILLPFLMGLVIFLYSPILLFKFCAFVAEGERLVETDYDELLEFTPEPPENTKLETDSKDWVFLDGSPPLTLLDSLRFLLCGVSKKHPIFISRIRRFIVLLLGPAMIYVQLYMYKDGMGVRRKHKVTVEEFIEAGTPLGFLSLLADVKHAKKTFVPIFGGPYVILSMYYVLGLLIFVMPTSVKQLVENGIPSNNASGWPSSAKRRTVPVSPFCFSFSDITHMAMVEPPKDRGYKKGTCLFKCSFFMLFTSVFWHRLFEIQVRRIQSFFQSQATVKRVLVFALLPLLIASGVIESLFSISYFAVPFFSFIFIMVKGALIHLINSKVQYNNKYWFIFRNPASVVIGTATIITLYLCFLYCSYLIFIESFSFVSQIIIFCFIAVIVYPSLSFGYLFFFIVLLYYLFRLFRDFGDGYLELLSTAVERSVELEYNINCVRVFSNQLVVSNVRVHPIHSIKINNVTLDVSQNNLQLIQRNCLKQGKIKKKGNAYGIPKKLFNFLVQKYRPMHIQILKLTFHLASILLLIVVAMSITSKFISGSSSELSEVMHVIFIVTVCALPRVLEVAMVNESKVVIKEIQNRNIEQSILQYWENQSVAEEFD